MKRLFFSVLMLAAVPALVTPQAHAQNPIPKATTAKPVRPRGPIPLDSFQLKLPSTISLGNVRVTTQELRDGKLIVLNSTTKKPNQTFSDSMLAMARELVYSLTDPKYYIPPDPINNLLRPVPPELTLESRFSEAERFILVPSWGKKLSIDQADYIVWFGVAMDEAIREILYPKPAKAGDPPPDVPPIMRINAARMLALAAQSGAPAHYPTIMELLKDPETEPQILIYTIQAAEGLIAAYNPILRDEARYMIHTIKDAQMVPLVEELEKIITRKTPYGPQPPSPVIPNNPPAAKLPQPAAKDGKPPIPTGQLEGTVVSSEQMRVIRYFRRAAIRALAKVRFPKFTDADSGKSAYPIMTLAKIAIGDPSITTAPGNDEVAYATMGLCNIHDYKNVQFDALADCIAQGVVNFAGKRAGNAQDKSIAWRVIGSQLMSALADMQRAPFAAKYRSKIDSLANTLTERVLLPLEKIGTPGNAPNFEAVARWREGNRVESLKLLDEPNFPVVVPGFVGTR